MIISRPAAWIGAAIAFGATCPEAARAQTSVGPDRTVAADVLQKEDGRVARGVIKALEEVTISAGVSARITSAPFREGDRFRKDDILISFDCAQLKAERAAAVATARGHKIAWQSNAKLKRYGAGGGYAVDTAKAEYDKSLAQIEALKARIAYCAIQAPFNGRIVEKGVSAHETPAANAPLLRIVSDSNLELQFVVPSRWLQWLRSGQQFEFRVDETGKTYAAQLYRIGAAVDPASQTVRLRATFERQSPELLSGMSGAARFLVRDTTTARNK